MKKLSTIVLVVFFALSLAACAAKSQKPDLVKCPACGYEGPDFIYLP